jgi:hypothetical protein
MIALIRGVSESSRTRSEKKYYRNLNLDAISFQIISLGTYTAILSFFPRLKSTVEVIFLNAVENSFRFSLDIRHCFKMSSLQFHFLFGKQSEITGGQVWRGGRMGNDNLVVVSHRLYGFQGRVGGCVVVMKEQYGVCSNFLLKSPVQLHK